MQTNRPAPFRKAAGEADDSQTADAAGLRTFVFALFFVFGGITSLNDVVVPKLKDLFTLSYGQAMLVQSAFFGAYLIFSIPAAAIVARAGYMRAASVGLLIMTVGCLLFIPAAASSEYPFFLAAMFVLGAGITTVQVVSNPLISLLGPPQTASSRLTFAQAFNSLGTTLFPIAGSILILSSLSAVNATSLTGAALDAYRTTEAHVVTRTYIGLAVALVALAAVVWTQRNRLKATPAEESILKAFALLSLPRFTFGTLCIFLYVGAEVSIGSLIVNYLMQADTLGLPQASAGKHVALYWGGAMVGRFVGSYLLRVISPGKMLAAVAFAAVGLILVSVSSHGLVSGYAILAIGLVNSIMFPTIFTLGCEGLGRRAAEGSGIICMAIVGGAVLPPITGTFADAIGLRLALLVPAACYLAIAAFGLFAARHPATIVRES